MSSTAPSPTPVRVAASPPLESLRLTRVFVYGSLLADEVVKVLFGRVPQSFPAVLDGYQRFSIRGRVYPAILPVENKRVTGRFYILDAFGDVEYKKCTVDITSVNDSKKLSSYVYVWSNGTDPNLCGEWNFEEWKRLHMRHFVKITTRFMKEFRGPHSMSRVEIYESFFHQGAVAKTVPQPSEACLTTLKLHQENFSDDIQANAILVPNNLVQTKLVPPPVHCTFDLVEAPACCTPDASPACRSLDLPPTHSSPVRSQVSCSPELLPIGRSQTRQPTKPKDMARARRIIHHLVHNDVQHEGVVGTKMATTGFQQVELVGTSSKRRRSTLCHAASLANARLEQLPVAPFVLNRESSREDRAKVKLTVPGNCNNMQSIVNENPARELVGNCYVGIADYFARRRELNSSKDSFTLLHQATHDATHGITQVIHSAHVFPAELHERHKREESLVNQLSEVANQAASALGQAGSLRKEAAKLMDEATKAKSELMDVRKELEKARALLRVKEEALNVEQEATSYEQKARVKAETELRSTQEKLDNPRFLEDAFKDMEAFNDFERKVQEEGLEFALIRVEAQFPDFDRRKIVDAFRRSWLPLTDAHENHFKHLISQGIPPHEAMDQVTACTPPCS